MSGLTRRSVLFAVPAAAAAIVSPALISRATADTPHQSPIDIRRGGALVSHQLPALHVHYPRSLDLEIRYERKDSGLPDGCEHRTAEETVLAEIPAGAAWVTLGGIRYDLANFHFHTRSEHRLDGHQYPLEQHWVHLGPNGEKLVIGLFITAGGHGGTLQDQALASVPAECSENVQLRAANLAHALPTDLSSFRYDGSLTTSPYSEPVSWLVLSHIREIKSTSLAHFQSRFPEGDSRPLQPLNGRTVAYRPQH